MLLQKVIDTSPDWIYVKDQRHQYLLVNNTFAAAQQVFPQDMIGKPDTDFFSEELCLGNPDKGIIGFHNDDAEAFQGSLVHNPKNIITWAEGATHIYDTYKMPLTDQSGKIYAVLIYSRDITERQKAEDDLVQSYSVLQKTLNDVINAFGTIVDMRDPYTAGHQKRVARLATAIAEELNLPQTQVDCINKAAVIHDVGKIYVPSDILSKPGRLADIELQMIKTHAQGSYEILKSIEFNAPVAKIVLQHHERIDGSGYPNKLKGQEILFEAKIVAVADVVEAMVSHRPYRAALGVEKAMDEISRNKDILYDSSAVDACLRLFKEKGFNFALDD
jgi:putative nucleotidyltransferase with HDIG domain